MSRVLIVDDQLISRMILEQLIRSLGDDTEPVSFADPVKALEWAKHNHHDLVLTDLKMPHMNGVQFTQRLRNMPSCVDVPVIIMTVSTTSALITGRSRRGGHRFPDQAHRPLRMPRALPKSAQASPAAVDHS